MVAYWHVIVGFVIMAIPLTYRLIRLLSNTNKRNS